MPQFTIRHIDGEFWRHLKERARREHLPLEKLALRLFELYDKCGLSRLEAASEPETQADEHARLLKRTAELRQETADLSLDRKPFDQAEHTQHQTDLRHHQDDLSRHRKRRKN